MLIHTPDRTSSRSSSPGRARTREFLPWGRACCTQCWARARVAFATLTHAFCISLSQGPVTSEEIASPRLIALPSGRSTSNARGSGNDAAAGGAAVDPSVVPRLQNLETVMEAMAQRQATLQATMDEVLGLLRSTVAKDVVVNANGTAQR